MNFEIQYRIFIVSLILGIVFYCIAEPITRNIIEPNNTIFEILRNVAIFGFVVLLSLLLLGFGTFIKRLEHVHFIYAHLTLVTVFAAYGIYFTLNNLLILYTGNQIVELLPVYIPEYVVVVYPIKPRYLLMMVTFVISIIIDILSLR